MNQKKTLNDILENYQRIENELINNDGVIQPPKVENGDPENTAFKICPDCDSKTLKTENGCDSCMACGYSKCDK